MLKDVNVIAFSLVKSSIENVVENVVSFQRKHQEEDLPRGEIDLD